MLKPDLGLRIGISACYTEEVLLNSSQIMEVFPTVASWDRINQLEKLTTYIPHVAGVGLRVFFNRWSDSISYFVFTEMSFELT